MSTETQQGQRGAGYRGSTGSGVPPPSLDHGRPPTTTDGWLRVLRDVQDLKLHVGGGDFLLLPPTVQARLRAHQAEFRRQYTKWGEPFGDALRAVLTDEGHAAVRYGVVGLRDICRQILKAYEEQAAAIEGMFPSEYRARRDCLPPPLSPSLLHGKGVLTLVGSEQWGFELAISSASIKPIRRIAHPPGNPDKLKATNAEVAEYAASLVYSPDARIYARLRPPVGNGPHYSTALLKAVAARFGLTTRQVGRKLRAADFRMSLDLTMGTGRRS